MMNTLSQYIVATPGVRSGKPRIAGRRITVADIAIAYLRMGHTIETIAQDYDLSLAAIHAAMSYYYDYQAEIDQSIANSEAFAEEFCQQHPSPLQEKLLRLKQRG